MQLKRIENVNSSCVCEVYCLISAPSALVTKETNVYNNYSPVQYHLLFHLCRKIFLTWCFYNQNMKTITSFLQEWKMSNQMLLFQDWLSKASFVEREGLVLKTVIGFQNLGLAMPQAYCVTLDKSPNSLYLSSLLVKWTFFLSPILCVSCLARLQIPAVCVYSS